MEIPQGKALEIIGAQQIELVVLRERVALLQQHRCEPCRQSCCQDGEDRTEPEPGA